MRPELEPFLELASVAKIDVSQLDWKGVEQHVDTLWNRGLQLVAERVETRDQLEACRAAGFDLFQGYFLARPATLQRHRPPGGDHLTALQIIALLNASNTSGR